MINLKFTTLLIFAALASEPLMAQSPTSCRSLSSDIDGDGYGWENDTSCVIDSTSSEAPFITNLETGDPVDLTRAYWRVNNFTSYDIACSKHQFDGSNYVTKVPENLYIFRTESETAPYNGIVEINRPGNDRVYPYWSLNNGIYNGPTDLALTPWVEVLSGSYPDGILTPKYVRVWLNNYEFTRCWPTNPAGRFVPTGSPPETIDTDIAITTNNNCDYSDAALYDGWGWNSISGTSCEPLDSTTTNNCDYTNAEIYDGWGWDAIAGQSCEPLVAINDTTTTDPDCDYSNSQLYDGWGWNPVTRLSCSPQ